jgi:hypothetical protein
MNTVEVNRDWPDQYRWAFRRPREFALHAGPNVRFGLFVLAYNQALFFRRLALPKDAARWTLQTIQTRLVKSGARLVRYARRVTMQMAEAAAPRTLWMGIAERTLRRRPG